MAKKKKKNLSYLQKYAFGDWLESNPNASMGVNNNQQYNSNINSPSMQGYQDPNYNPNGAKTAAGSTLSSINPVIGMVNSGVRSMTSGMEAKANAIDSNTGGYENMNKQIVGSQAEGFADPLTASIKTFQDPSANFGDKASSILLAGFSTFNRAEDKANYEDTQMREAYAREKNKRGQIYNRQMQQQDFANADKSEYSGLSNFEFGGNLDGMSTPGGFRKYDGKSHEDSKYDGIPVDKNGEPSIMSGGETVGLTEGDEVKYTFKDKNTYIFSDKF